MKKNKALTRVYIIVMICVGLALVVNGATYLLKYYIDDDEVVNLIIPLAVGMCELVFGFIALTSGIKSLQFILDKKEVNESNNAISVDNANKNPNLIRKQGSPFYSLHVLCLCTLIVFILAIFQAYLIDESENIFIVIPLFAGFFIALIPDVIVKNLKKKNKINENKYRLLNEMVFIIGAVYCLIINIIFYFDITTLVVMSVLLAMEIAIAVDLIICLRKKDPAEEEVIEAENISVNELGIDDRFIKKHEDNDDFSI